MSEKEQANSGTANSSVVLVEKTASSRSKIPFHLSEMQEESPPELHHKRSKAPAVPSVAEELKDTNTESRDRTECERAMSSEKHKQTVTKKLSSKRRSSSPETITLAPLMVDEKKSNLVTQPIPAQLSVPSANVDPAGKLVDRKDEDDSVTEDIAELRNPEVAKISSDWSDDEEASGLPRSESRASRVSRAVRQLFCCGVQMDSPSEARVSPRTTDHANNSGDAKRKEVSWNDGNYLDKVKLENVGAKSRHCELERKSSIGPCFRSVAPFGRPSGISISYSKKSVTTIPEEYNPAKSVINITVSKKCLINKTIYRPEKVIIPPDDDQNKEIQDLPKVNFFGTLRQRICDMGDKVKNVFA